MAVPRDGNRAVHKRADECPDEAGHSLCPTGHDLQTEGQTVDIGAIVGDDAESEDDEAELAEAAERGEEDCGEETADAGLFVALGVAGVDGVEGGGCDG